MKLYLAYCNSVTLMEGRYEQCLGVFDSKEKAWAYLSTTRDYEHSKRTKGGRVYHFDGELSYYWQVVKVELNKPIAEEV